MQTSGLQRCKNTKQLCWKSERIPLVHTYSPALPYISSMLLKQLPVIRTSKTRCRKAAPEPPTEPVCHRSTNLKDMLVYSTTALRNINPGFSPCNNCRCKTRPLFNQNCFFSIIHRGSNMHNQPEPLLLLSKRHLSHHIQSMQQTKRWPDVTNT